MGAELDFTDDKIFIHQQSMIEKLANKHEITKFYSTPMQQDLNWNENSTKLEDIRKLQAIFGELNYLNTVSRPDISYSVNMIARRLHDGSKEVIRAAKRIMAYVYSTRNLGLEIKKQKEEK